MASSIKRPTARVRARRETMLIEKFAAPKRINDPTNDRGNERAVINVVRALPKKKNTVTTVKIIPMIIAEWKIMCSHVVNASECFVFNGYMLTTFIRF